MVGQRESAHAIAIGKVHVFLGEAEAIKDGAGYTVGVKAHEG